MSRTYLYHASIGFPTNLRRPSGIAALLYGPHAMNAANEDRYGVAQLPIAIELDDAHNVRLVEAEALADGTMLKGVYRVTYNRELVLVMVVSFTGLQPFVKSVWFNEKTDRHPTLRRELYDVPK